MVANEAGLFPAGNCALGFDGMFYVNRRDRGTKTCYPYRHAGM
jgi:hypothetical protein